MVRVRTSQDDVRQLWAAFHAALPQPLPALWGSNVEGDPMQEQSAPSLGDMGRGPTPPPSGPVPPPVNADKVPQPPAPADEPVDPTGEPTATPDPVTAADHPSDHGGGKGDQGKQKGKKKKPPKKPKAADEHARAEGAAIALILGDVEGEIKRWWPVLQEHAVHTLGEFGGRITITLDFVPEDAPGEGKFVIASELGKLKNLPSTRRAQIATGVDGAQQLVLFSA